MTAGLLPARFMFQFKLPCRKSPLTWGKHGLELDDTYLLPNLQGMEGMIKPFAELRMGWNPAGFGVQLSVQGKTKSLWCRETRPDESDSLHLWIDTRATHNVHRATRFCHAFVAMPLGGGRQLDQAYADQRLINRARENAKPVRAGTLQAQAHVRPDGYSLSVLIPAAALTGFETREQPILGFNYAVIDREFGLQTLSAGATLPYQEDPSLWATLELVD